MPTDCPNRDQLKTWLNDDSGDLSNDVDTCGDCQATVRTLLEGCDAFLGSFREVAIHAAVADPSQRQAIDAIKAQVIDHFSTRETDNQQEENADSDQWLGRTLGQYRIDALLGAGGMGRVYRGWHLHMQREVAVKLLLTSRASQRQAAERFAREWVASAK